MALKFWRPKSRGLRRLSSSGFRLSRGKRGFSGVFHMATPKKFWTTSMTGPKQATKGKVKLDSPMEMEEAAVRGNRDQVAFQKQIDKLPGSKKRGNDVSRVKFYNELTKEDIDEIITQHIGETTLSGNIGGFNKPFAARGDFKRDDIAFAGRNKVAPAMGKNAVRSLRRAR